MVKVKDILRRCVVLGFGGVAKPVCHILSTRYPMKEYILVDRKRITDDEIKLFGLKKVSRLEMDIKPEELFETMMYILKDGDVVCDFFGCNETIDILHACHLKKGIVYVNASIEENILKPYPSQNALYQAFQAFKKKYNPVFAGCIDAGANPGMITHFSILGLFSMAKYAIEKKTPDYDKIENLLRKKDIAGLCEILKVDVIHISEIEQIEPYDSSKLRGYVTNSWCINSFLDEWNTNGEVSVGTHDKKALSKKEYIKIPLSKPPAVKCPFPLYMKTASPKKIFTGKVVVHPETLEISKIFSTEKHIPTVAFIYHPSRTTRLNLEKKDWKKLPRKVFDESNSGPLTGSETMGETLISSRNDIPPRWFGSIVTCEQEREIGAQSNPTTLQVAAGIISHLILLLENPGKGLCQPYDFDSEKIMEIAKFYLGTIVDINLPFRLPTSWEDLISSKEKMDMDLITIDKM
jgi:homospermidine synthase